MSILKPALVGLVFGVATNVLTSYVTDNGVMILGWLSDGFSQAQLWMPSHAFMVELLALILIVPTIGFSRRRPWEYLVTSAAIWLFSVVLVVRTLPDGGPSLIWALAIVVAMSCWIVPANVRWTRADRYVQAKYPGENYPTRFELGISHLAEYRKNRKFETQHSRML